MFDISFTELMAVSVVALLVIGPEKLPKIARMAGALTGRVQKMVAQVKDEVNREVRFEELQKLQQEVESAASDVKSSLDSEVNHMRSIAEDLEMDLSNETVTPIKKPGRKPRSAAKPKMTSAKPKNASTKKPAVKKTTDKSPAKKKVTASTKKAK